jgi:hypothetical protein
LFSACCVFFWFLGRFSFSFFFKHFFFKFWNSFNLNKFVFERILNWTDHKYAKNFKFWNKFRILNYFQIEHFLNRTNFWIEHFLNLNIFLIGIDFWIWIDFEFEHISNLNRFSNLNFFLFWTDFKFNKT